MEAITLSLIATAIATAIGWVGKRSFDRWRLKHMQTLLGGSKSVKIILPMFYAPMFSDEKSAAKGAQIPKNIHLMPLAEGRAVAEMVQAIRLVSPKSDIIIQSQDEFIDDSTPFISIGGPSVNTVSKEIIEKYWHEFKLIYPEHYAQYGDVTYKPTIKEQQLLSDFGFSFQTIINSGTPSLVFCGVWAFGTEMAVRAYLNLTKQKGDIDLKKKLKKKNNVLIISTGDINSYRIGLPTIIGRL